MGPPLRSSAADAHYCIMVQIPRIYRIQVCGAMLRAQLASAPQIVPNSETQHHTREQSELPRLTLDGKIPIQVVGHRAGAPFLDRQPGLGAVERLDLALLGVPPPRAAFSGSCEWPKVGLSLAAW
jgi:hypothetical protein